LPDNLIIERVIGIVYVAENNAAFSFVSSGTAGSSDEHTSVASDLFAAETPLGTYRE
jgi:hypothetical protein